MNIFCLFCHRIVVSGAVLADLNPTQSLDPYPDSDPDLPHNMKYRILQLHYFVYICIIVRYLRSRVLPFYTLSKLKKIYFLNWTVGFGSTATWQSESERDPDQEIFSGWIAGIHGGGTVYKIRKKVPKSHKNSVSSQNFVIGFSFFFIFQMILWNTGSRFQTKNLYNF